MAKTRTRKGKWGLVLGASIFLLLVVGVWALYVDNVNHKHLNRVRDAVYSAGMVRDAVTHYYEDHRALPPDRQALLAPKGREPYLALWPQYPRYAFDVKGGTVTIAFDAGNDPLAGKSVVLKPAPAKLVLEWECRTNIDAPYRPSFCKAQ